jgi:CHAD domain-containing protein
MSIRDHAAEQASLLFARFASCASRTAKVPDPSAVHDLRVAIRRLSQCLRVFHELFPEKEVKRVRARLRRLMKLAADVRNQDVAIDLLHQAGAAPDSTLLARLARRRKQAERNLTAALAALKNKDFFGKHRRRLKLAAGPAS